MIYCKPAKALRQGKSSGSDQGQPLFWSAVKHPAALAEDKHPYSER
jgi:hypothetical protein